MRHQSATTIIGTMRRPCLLMLMAARGNSEGSSVVLMASINIISNNENESTLRYVPIQADSINETAPIPDPVEPIGQSNTNRASLCPRRAHQSDDSKQCAHTETKRFFFMPGIARPTLPETLYRPRKHITDPDNTMPRNSLTFTG